jgi:hypothetical protein
MRENESSKRKDKRLEEKGEPKAELKRSLAAAKAKFARKQTEGTEKL